MKDSHNKSFAIFFKSMLYTAAALVLLVIGYFTAGYFSGGL